MADNYLEKKMEEHRRGALSRTNVRRMPLSGEQPGTVRMKIDTLRVIVTDGAGDYAPAIIGRLRGAGCRVAFRSDDEKGGRALAQKSGARFYPASFAGCVADDLTKVWGGVDAVIVTDGVIPDGVETGTLRRIISVGTAPDLSVAECCVATTVNGIDIRGFTPADAAHLCLMLCLTDSSCINGMIFRSL